MKLKSLHPQKHFFKFISLVLLVLGASVGVILTTQKQTVFDESRAAAGCYNSCTSSGGLGEVKCVGDKLYQCMYRYGRYFYDVIENCNRKNMRCVNGAAGDCRGAHCAGTTLNVCDTNGETRCAGTKIERCTDGIWTIYKDCSTFGEMCISSQNNAVCVVCRNDEYRCNGNKVEVCRNSQWQFEYYCGSNQSCVTVGASRLALCVDNSSNTPPRTPTSQPIVTCRYDCTTRYECNNDGGTIVSGRCGGGAVCCNYGI